MTDTMTVREACEHGYYDTHGKGWHQVGDGHACDPDWCGTMSGKYPRTHFSKGCPGGRERRFRRPDWYQGADSPVQQIVRHEDNGKVWVEVDDDE